MEPTFNLSPLISGKYRDPDATGRWAQSGPLGDLATSLDVPRSEAEIDRLKSLPDVWARPLLFGHALTNKDHIARKAAIRQWRGLLALLGLSNFYANKYVIGLINIDLADESTGNPQFRKVLRQLKPTETITSQASWDKFGVLTLQPKGEDRFDVGEHTAIGLLVPNCIVAPAKSTSYLKVPSVPWLANGLGDPLDQDAMPAAQWAALYDYLGRIKVRLKQPDIVKSAGVDAIRNEVDAFMAGCREKLADAGVGNAPEARYASAKDEVPSSLYEVLLDPPLQPEDDRLTDCEVLVPAESDLLSVAGGIKGIILIDPAIARTLNRPIQDVKAWKGYSLQAAVRKEDLDAIRKEALGEGYLVVTPEDLLTAKLVRLLNDGKVEAHGPKWENLLLPLSPLGLLLTGKDKIVDSLELNDRGDRFEVGLTIGLKGGEDLARPGSHQVVQSYDKKADTDEQAVPDDIVLWPNKSFAGWPWNFMRFSYDSRYEMAPRFAASRGSLSAMVTAMAKGDTAKTLSALQALGDQGDLVFERIHPVFNGDMAELKSANGDLILHRVRFRNVSDAIGEQHILGKGSETIFFSGKLGDDDYPSPAGCLMLPKKPASLNQGSMRIAVDFGTTNTVVYYSTGSSGSPEAMVFEERVFRPLWSKLAEEDQFAYDCVEFLPARDVPSPFPTVMHKRVFDLGGSEALKDGAASGYHGIADNIFFMPNVPSRIGYAAEREAKEQLEFDLKWGTDSKQKRMVRRFLRQIVLMSTVEAMSRNIQPQNIEWHFSYPQAWDHTQVSNFQKAVTQAWEEILHPVLGKSEKALDHIRFETEGAAALRYFIKGPSAGKTGQRVLMLDIGGGSTEIAIYDLEKNVWRGSFKLAGGDFFTRFLSNNTKIFEQFKDDVAGDTSEFERVLKEFGGNESTRHFVELYISQDGFNESFGESYPMFSEEAEGLGLRNAALVMIAGYFYYSGLVVRSLIERRQLRANSMDEFTVAFAGRGSSFFKFLGEMRNDESPLGRAVRMMTDVVLAGEEEKAQENPETWTFTNPRVNESFSELPKHEVAYGMLCGDAAGRKKAMDEAIPLGESVELLSDGEELSLSALHNISELPPGARLIDIGEDEFDRFLELLRQRVGLKINIDSKGGEARSQINNTVKYAFSGNLDALENYEESEDDDETLEIEPPFISKLRCLVHMLAQNVAARKEEVVVRTEAPR